MEVASLSVFLVMDALQAVVAIYGRPGMFQPACILSHTMRSMTLCCAAFEVLPCTEGMKAILGMHIELLVDLLFDHHDQVRRYVFCRCRFSQTCHVFSIVLKRIT